MLFLFEIIHPVVKRIASIIIFSLIVSSLHAQQSVSHHIWTELLQKHVNPYGKVNYKGFQEDEDRLDEYLELLKKNHPDQYWKVEDQKAYWINAYNAFTVKMILMHYPLKTIMDIKKDGKDAWHIPFIHLGDKLYTLDYIEHTMLLGQYNDSRIHFAINCTAKSCPPLKNKAYSPDNLDIELRLAARIFINDKRFNLLERNHMQISEIFNWYKDDFLKEEPSVQVYINKRTPHLEISPDASINYMKYNWDLNELK